MRDFTDVWKVAARSLARGKPDFLADLGIALTEAYGPGAVRIRQYRHVLGHLLQSLAVTPGPENIAEALRLASSAEAVDRRVGRETASVLASCHPAEDLTVAFTGKATEELRSCLVHELVLRGVAVMEFPVIAAWAESSHWSFHPLRWLPWTRSEVEGRPELPHYGARGSSHSLPYGPAGSGRAIPATRARLPRAEETTTEAAATRIGSAVANWVEESNGLVEARVFRPARPVDAGSVPALMRTLGLGCLETKGKKKDGFTATASSPGHAWAVLFAAASTGGAYNSGTHGAYGRLAAWHSLAGLAGAAEESTVEEVEARVRGCDWYSFDTSTGWFNGVAWDIGLAALSPDGLRLAVLAATDTD